ncbi:MAG: glycogen/starch/alpha-glucan phosphorylase [Crocosphaera sp.]|nr:glycogen/starch/alpha-glucan phosphorylase [Crocosphaera sp.]
MSTLSPKVKNTNAKTTNIKIEDDRTGMSKETLKRALLDHLFYIQGVNRSRASLRDYYMSLSYTIRDRLLHRFLNTIETYKKEEVKIVSYFSAEFLMGRHLGNNLVNLGLYDTMKEIMAEMNIDFDDIIEQEPDPGLGNGGLGRLAACFLDSLASLAMPAIGYGIRYEFGIFHQTIQDGWQVEIPDNWLRFENPWEIARPSEAVEIKLGGHTEKTHDENGNLKTFWVADRTILAIPYDTPVPGYKTNTVNPLRLWKAEASESFNFEAFNAGHYDRAVEEKMDAETISKVLYPNDNTPAGRQLRLAQQYFFVSASLQDLIRIHLRNHPNLDHFAEKVAVQLNDTHPAVAVAELMRLLIDKHDYNWEKAWEITTNTLAYTNHTLMPEALERWPVTLFGSLLPRHLEIIYELNYRFLENVRTWFPGDDELISNISLIEERSEKLIRMANLACLGSHAINGVAALHTELLKQDTLKHFAKLWPEKFYNKTNGVTPRRWILLSNPKLSSLITEKIGDGWSKNLDEMRQLEKFADDAAFRKQWREIKQENKRDLAAYLLKYRNIHIDPNTMFDVQVKRIHEYKRQHLMVLEIITLYNRIKENPDGDYVSRTFLFGGKAAPGYFMAKLIIKLINAVADVVNNDPDVRGRLKVVFMPNFNVSLGQRVYPAADLSEQISTAGKEASGTGNMKFAMNGALTIGTLDGANIEIREEAHPENFFLFGLTAHEVYDRKAHGYSPSDYYHNNGNLKGVIDRISSGYFSHGNCELFQPIVDQLMSDDPYMLMADYQAYVDCQDAVSQAYRDEDNWTRMSILNSARMGKFSSDRTIAEYCEQIWNVKPVDIKIEEYNPNGANN